MKTIKGPALFLAQFAGDAAPFNSWAGITRWAAECGYVGVQVPSWDARLFDLDKAATSQTYCDDFKGVAAEAGIIVTELSTHLQGQLVAAVFGRDDALDRHRGRRRGLGRLHGRLDRWSNRWGRGRRRRWSNNRRWRVGAIACDCICRRTVCVARRNGNRVNHLTRDIYLDAVSRGNRGTGNHTVHRNFVVNDWRTTVVNWLRPGNQKIAG